MMKEILLVGGGGHCKSVIDVIEQEAKYKVIGIVDKKELVGQYVLGYRIIGCDDDLPELSKIYKNAMVSVGHVKSNTHRIRLFTLLKGLGFDMPVIISPLSYLSKHAKVDEGTVIMHHALVNADARIGKNCIINSKALIEHDAVIEDNVHISTSAVVNGGTVVKEDTFFGSGAVAKEYVTLGGFIKAGSIVK